MTAPTPRRLRRISRSAASSSSFARGRPRLRPPARRCRRGSAPGWPGTRARPRRARTGWAGRRARAGSPWCRSARRRPARGRDRGSPPSSPTTSSRGTAPRWCRVHEEGRLASGQARQLARALVVHAEGGGEHAVEHALGPRALQHGRGGHQGERGAAAHLGDERGGLGELREGQRHPATPEKSRPTSSRGRSVRAISRPCVSKRKTAPAPSARANSSDVSCAVSAPAPRSASRAFVPGCSATARTCPRRALICESRQPAKSAGTRRSSPRMRSRATRLGLPAGQGDGKADRHHDDDRRPREEARGQAGAVALLVSNGRHPGSPVGSPAELVLVGQSGDSRRRRARCRGGPRPPCRGRPSAPSLRPSRSRRERRAAARADRSRRKAPSPSATAKASSGSRTRT